MLEIVETGCNGREGNLREKKERKNPASYMKVGGCGGRMGKLEREAKDQWKEGREGDLYR